MAKSLTTSAKMLKELSFDFFANATDLTLFCLSLGGELAFSGTRALTHSGATNITQSVLDTFEGIDRQKVRRALRNLADRGLINIINDGRIKAVIANRKHHGLLPVDEAIHIRPKAQRAIRYEAEDTTGLSPWSFITSRGRDRLFRKFPRYEDVRPWDGIFYVVTYDVPIEHNADRNLLRIFLRKIGCASFQDSNWVTPYNPIELLDEFSRQKNLQGTILVTTLARDMTVGGFGLKEFLEKVYNLAEISKRYTDFSEKYYATQNKPKLLLEYYSILRDDPQLPFELLPMYWQGARAYALFQNLTAGMGV